MQNFEFFSNILFFRNFPQTIFFGKIKRLCNFYRSNAIIGQMSKSSFKKGDTVTYPLHGVGEIISIFDREHNDVVTKFYKIKIAESSGMLIYVPYEKAESLGLRKIVKKSEITSVLRKLTILPGEIEENWKLRFQEI